MLRTGRINKNVSPGIFLNIYKMITNMKLTFTDVTFRHNSACVIQNWLRLKRIITVRLVYISEIFPNVSKITQLLLPNYFEQLKTEVLYSH